MTISLSDAGVQFPDASGVTNAPPFAFKNLQASATGISATITVTADEVALANSANFYLTARAVSLSISGASSGVANGLDTGTLAASTWYSVWVIGNGATTAGLLSLSSTSPTLPSGYTFKARVGWIRTDGTANKYPFSFQQRGRQVYYAVNSGSNLTSLPLIVNGGIGSISTPTYVATSTASFVPTTSVIIKLLSVQGDAATTNTIAAPNSSYGAAGNSTNPPPLNSSFPTGVGGSIPAEFPLESVNIYAATSTASCKIAVRGWEDNL